MTKQLRCFLIILLMFSTIFYGISILITQLHMLDFDNPIFISIYAIAGYSPAISAIITIACYYTKKECIEFFIKVINIKINILYYLYVLVCILILWVPPYIISVVNGGIEDMLSLPLYYILIFTPMMIFAGGIEEIGWRGFLLPNLLKKLSVTKSSLLIGIIWSVWHIPMWFVIGSPQQKLNFITFFISCIASSLLLSLLYIKTRSVWVCILFHAIDNACFQVFTYSIDSNYITAFYSILIIAICYYVLYKLTIKSTKYNI